MNMINDARHLARHEWSTNPWGGVRCRGPGGAGAQRRLRRLRPAAVAYSQGKPQRRSQYRDGSDVVAVAAL